MPYAHQDNVVERLHVEAKQVMRRKVEDPAQAMFIQQWTQARLDVSAFGRGVWAEAGPTMDVVKFKQLNVQQRLTDYMSHRLGDLYKREALAYIERIMRHAYRTQAMTTLWIMDQVTPPNVEVRPRRSIDAYTPTGRPRAHAHVRRKVSERERLRAKRARESWLDEPPEGQSNVDPAGEPQPSYQHWLDAWLKGFGATAVSTAAMGAVSQATPRDFGASLDDLRVTGRTPEQVLSTMVRGQVNVAIDDAQDDMHDDWDQVLQTRVWLSKGDARVCPICRGLDGLTEEQVAAQHHGAEPGYVHILCRCRWMEVPNDFRALAGDLSNPSADPREMTILDPETGQPMATVIVSFPQWEQNVARTPTGL